MTTSPLLAIVIPAWKPDFLDEALSTIAAQHDRRFCVYVGDDAGPPEIADICARQSAAGLDLVYHRFDENLGGHSLPAQWNRCIALSTEPWVWLFGDDDRMEPGCVSAIYEALEGEVESSLLRFDTITVDAEGQVIRENPPHPPEESGADFLFARLSGSRASFAVEYVVRREAFDRAGGFPDFPMGWAADDAAWYRFAEARPIVKLPGSRVHWRASGQNITSMGQRFQREKLDGAARLVQLIREEVRHVDPAGRSPELWARVAARWYRGQIRGVTPLSIPLWPYLLRISCESWDAPALVKLLAVAWWNLRAMTRLR